MSLNFTKNPDLLTRGNGGKIQFSTDDFFGVAENLIEDGEALWNPTTYTAEGKEMDGWETRRKRGLGHDWCIARLGFAGRIFGFDADTAHFTGNNAPAISIQAALLPDLAVENVLGQRVSKRGTNASDELMQLANSLNSNEWKTILPFTKLSPGVAATRHHLLECIDSESRWTHLRVNIYPDGGLARLRVYGQVVPDWDSITTADFLSLGLGTTATEWSNAHYGHPIRMIAPGRSTGMHDGWETARNPNRPAIYVLDPQTHMIDMPGSEWAIFKLGAPCTNIYRFLIDTNHYKGNYPESCKIEGSCDGRVWVEVVGRRKLEAHRELVIEKEELMNVDGPVSWVKVTMYPGRSL